MIYYMFVGAREICIIIQNEIDEKMLLIPYLIIKLLLIKKKKCGINLCKAPF